jgi:hypothetical protein
VLGGIGFDLRAVEGRKKSGKPAALPLPDPKVQKNFTDPESRIMKGKDGFVQAYNDQIAGYQLAVIGLACVTSWATMIYARASSGLRLLLGGQS